MRFRDLKAGQSFRQGKRVITVYSVDHVFKHTRATFQTRGMAGATVTWEETHESNVELHPETVIIGSGGMPAQTQHNCNMATGC